MPSVSRDWQARPLAVLASRVRYEEKLILAELDRRGVSYQVVDPRQTAFRLDRLDIPWRGVLLREISHHRSLYAARVLEHAGIPVVNSARAIAVCGDKLLTTLALDAAGLPVPRCLVALAPEAALDALGSLGYPAVIKPLVGSWGRQVARLNDRDAAEAVLEYRAALSDPRQRITYAQQYIDKPGRDIRGLVIGEEVVGAVYRIGPDWRTGTRRGARTALCPLTDDLIAMLRAAAAAVEEGVYGIDVLEDRDGGRYVCEVNHTPEFHGAAEVLSVNIAGLYADYVLRRLAAAAPAGETAGR